MSRQVSHPSIIRTFLFDLPATFYEDGVYFWTSAIYSARPMYSPADSNGCSYIYLYRVLTGKYTKGEKGLKEPPEKDEKNLGDRYDSVADNTSDNPNLFVVLSDTQAYSEYLIIFKGI